MLGPRSKPSLQRRLAICPAKSVWPSLLNWCWQRPAALQVEDPTPDCLSERGWHSLPGVLH
eukprot:1122173-Lingulodinium_polyedra.AAC.1